MQAQQSKINISEALQQINWYELESLEEAIAERKRQMIVNRLNNLGFKFKGIDTGDSFDFQPSQKCEGWGESGYCVVAPNGDFQSLVSEEQINRLFDIQFNLKDPQKSFDRWIQKIENKNDSN